MERTEEDLVFSRLGIQQRDEAHFPKIIIYLIPMFMKKVKSTTFNKQALLQRQETIQIKDNLNSNTRLLANTVIFQVRELRAQHQNNLILHLFLLFINLYQEQFGKVKKPFLKKDINARKSNPKLSPTIINVKKSQTTKVNL